MRAILEGRKSVTRRTTGLEVINESPDGWTFDRVQDGYPDGRLRYVFVHDSGDHIGLTCPYGDPGDHLWVRETWAVGRRFDKTPPRDVPEGSFTWHEATHEGDLHIMDCGVRGRWRPSIHMPRWVCRKTLENIAVRPERLSAITAEEAIAEGVPSRGIPEPTIASALMYIEDFAQLWDSINATRDGGIYSFDANPVVWVIRFAPLTSSTTGVRNG